MATCLAARGRRQGGHFHSPGAWPFGITAYAGRGDNDLILWLPSIGAIVTGDSLSDLGDGLDIWIADRKHVTRDDVVQRLRPLFNLPVELVLPAHGRPDGSRSTRARSFLSGDGKIQRLRRRGAFLHERSVARRQSGIKTTL